MPVSLDEILSTLGFADPTKAKTRLKEAVDYDNLQKDGQLTPPPQVTVKRWVAQTIKDAVQAKLHRKQRDQDALDQRAVGDAVESDVKVT